MFRLRNVIAIGAVLLAGIVGLTLAKSGVPYPEIPTAHGEFCVEDTDFMRRNHMDLLLHQRDETVKEGIRSKQHSLRECIDCHAVTGPDEVLLTADSPDHFCRSCHDYAAVKIDCFDCHASRPERAVVAEVENK